jgi:FMN phosphatase YigB (HAD superfamily)
LLIIFDLDDTLIDTTRAITPKRHHAVFEALQLEGWERFVEINKSEISSKRAFEVFFTERGLSKELFQKACTLLEGPLSDEMEVPPTPGALALLKRLQAFHTLALVTLGNPDLQLQKMKKAGIQPEIFSKIVVGSGPSKKSEYQRILAELEFSPQEAIVCGDRISVDLTPAKAFGLKTAHYPRGRGEGITGDLRDVDYTLVDLEDLEKYIASEVMK